MSGVNPVALNAAARNALMNAGDRTQLVGPVNQITPGGGLVTVGTQNIRQIGVTTRLFVVGSVTISNTSANAMSLTPNGLANLITNVNLQDPWQNIKINASMRDVLMFRSIRARGPYGAAFTTDTPLGFTAAYRSNYAPATIAANSSVTLQFVFEIPCARDVTKGDFRGALLTQSINQQSQLQLTFNAAPVVPSTADAFNAVYTGAAGAGAITGGTFRIVQEYYTLPAASAQIGFPMLDLATLYKIEAFPFQQAPVANTDNINLVPNYRQIMNALIVLDNGVIGPAATDLNTVKVFPNANYQTRGLDPLTLDFLARDNMAVGFPLGYYWLDFRDKPLYTPAVGQAQIVPNFATVNAGAAGYIAYESLMASADVSLAGAP